MKGFALILLGMVLIAMCGLGVYCCQLDGFSCAMIALFLGGAMIISGMVYIHQNE